MIFKMITSAVLVVAGAYWAGGVMMERDRCLQIDKAAAPVRLAMEAARKADSNFQFVADQLTWLSWSVRADEMTQALMIKAFYGDRLSCKGAGPEHVASQQRQAPLDAVNESWR